MDDLNITVAYSILSTFDVYVNTGGT